MKILIVFLFCCLSLKSLSQVTWSHGQVTSAYSTTSNEQRVLIYKVVFQAKIEEGWHIYSQNQDSNCVCVPNHIAVKDTLNSQVSGVSEKGSIILDSRPDIGIRNWEFKNELTYTIWFFAKQKTTTILITYQACTDEQCNPAQTESFVLNF